MDRRMQMFALAIRFGEAASINPIAVIKCWFFTSIYKFRPCFEPKYQYSNICLLIFPTTPLMIFSTGKAGGKDRNLI